MSDIVRLPPGSRIASRHGMSRKYGVARATVDKAIETLEGEGILHSVKGKGTYVSSALGMPKGSAWGVILPSVLSDVYPGILRGIEDVARLHQINTIICNTDNDVRMENEYIRRLAMDGVSGLIIIPAITGHEARSVYDILCEKGIPFVFCNRCLDGLPGAPLVCSNGFYGAYAACKHLLSMGYERIAFLAPNRYIGCIERYNGYAAALAEAGLEVDDRIVATQLIGDDDQTVIGCATRMLESENPPDAFFCFNDRVATKVYRAITRKGLRVSGDIGLMGYDNSDSCEICDVKLTSVDYRNLEIGRKAAELLYGMNLGEHTPAFTIHTFMPQIIERESCLGKRAPTALGGFNEFETAGERGA